MSTRRTTTKGSLRSRFRSLEAAVEYPYEISLSIVITGERSANR